MPPLTIVSSDRPDTLVERLALDLADAPLGPFDEETIVVQSRGTERWVRHELARRHGCAAGLWFPFAASFFRELAESLSDSSAGATGTVARASTSRVDDAFGRDALTWRIYDLLDGGLCDDPGFETLLAFITEPHGRDTRKMLGLARTLAARYTEYQLYRPGVLQQWERDQSSGDWQATLWRCICASNAAECHAGAQYRQAVETLRSAAKKPAGLPSRLSVFGVNTLPPIYVELLHAVAKHIPVRVYLQAPPRSTWRSAPKNPLFATFGGVVRDFVELVETRAPADEPVRWEEHHAGHEASERGILARLQADVQLGVERGSEQGLEPRITIAADTRDESLSLHLCHSPMREMEVLRDQLLAAFAADSTLRPHDILLLVPEVATYAPFVDAVFGVSEPELPRIPYRIADRAVAQESRIADASLRILRLVGARWTTAEIVELLDLPPVRRAAGLPDDGAARVLPWIEETRIRWGRDGAMRREQFDLPPVEANSWRAGMDRLLMGYATGPTRDFVADVLPCSGDTIGDPATLGAFAHFLERLFDTLSDWRSPRTLAAWSEELRSAFAALLQAEDDDEECELDVVLSAVSELSTLDLDRDASRAVELPVVRDWLEERLGAELTSGGFLAGGMTVAALRAMRVVPHRIVAIAGLDDTSFPRSQPRAAFDLLARKKLLGDRDRRADDRQAFLDTLLATGERLILSYVARSPQTNAERAASVVVAELLDVVDRTFDAGAVRARTLVEVEHRLQPFSPAYFTGGASSRLFSYSRANARALSAMSGEGRNGARPFVSGPLSVPTDDDAREIRLDDLIDCWTNPSRFFCTRTLGLHLRGEAAPLDECEPMSVNHLDRYKVHDEMLRRHLSGGRTPERERAEAVALGQLPSGALCGVWFDCLDEELSGLLASLGDVRLEDPVHAEVSGATWTVRGRVDGITGMGRLQVRPANCKPSDLIRAWITHLALSASFGPTVTHVVAKDCHTVFGEVEQPLALLESLVQGYRAALYEPMPFFTQASHAYVEQEIRLQTSTRASKPPLEAVLAKLRCRTYDDSPPGDLDDAYVSLCWRGRDPLADAAAEFERHATAFWRPAMAAMRSAGKGGQ